MLDGDKSEIYLFKNGGLIAADSDIIGANSLTVTRLTHLAEADGDDYFELFVRHDSGADRTINGAATQTYFQGYQIS